MNKIDVRINTDPKTKFQKEHPIEIHGLALKQQFNLNLDEAFELYKRLYDVCGFKPMKKRNVW